MKLANEANLIIANGRTIGDLNGRFTCHKYNGSSVVDYCLMSCHLYDTARYFKVHDPQFYSDHCPISVALNTRRTIYNTNNDVLQPLPVKYIWDEEDLISLLSENLINAGDGSLRVNINTNKVVNKNHIIYSNEIADVKINFRRSRRQYTRDTTNIERRIAFYKDEKNI